VSLPELVEMIAFRSACNEAYARVRAIVTFQSVCQQDASDRAKSSRIWYAAERSTGHWRGRILARVGVLFLGRIARQSSESQAALSRFLAYALSTLSCGAR